MATNKNAILRYIALDRCFRNRSRRFDITALVDVCNEALLDIDPSSSGIRKRQVYDDIKFMRDSRGYDAAIESFKEGKKAYYRYTDPEYSINKKPLTEHEAIQLKESLLTISRFKGLPQFEWIHELISRLEQSFHLKSEKEVIGFDDNPYLIGRENISELFNAIVNRHVLSIKYQPFNHEKKLNIEIHPYYLKQYNNRWFLLGLNSDEERITNLALDRIIGIEPSQSSFIPNTEIDFEEFFENIVGVSNPEKGKPEKINLKIERNQWNYIKTKPIHGSQKKKDETKEYVIIELELIPNFEFESVILSFGETIEIISPEHLRSRINDRISTMFKKYQICAD